jgi:2-amino-4-hydroxy-6-hydroxymethyldihydropteridine diphosphokinase
MKLMEGIYLLLGSNLGEKKENLINAIKLLDSYQIKVVKRSSLYETAAWGKTDQASFFNQVIQIETLLEPQLLLNTILSIEIKLGRVRKEHWGARLIDIDILYFNNIIIDTPDLKIPHPGIPSRRFTLIPLVEIAEEFIHPIYLQNQQTLLQNCADLLAVQLVT